MQPGCRNGGPSCESVERKPKSWTILSIIAPQKIASFHNVSKTGLARVSFWTQRSLSGDLNFVFF